MKKNAFTLAEVLITLVIIGVVAAITVPMLMNDTNDKQWNVAKQKAKATIGEAFRLMTVNGEITDNLTTKEFVEQIVPKYLKIAKTCDEAVKCGFSEKVKRIDGVEVSLPTTWKDSTLALGIVTPVTTSSHWATINGERKTDNPTTQNFNDSYFFQTLDGFSVNLFYNPYCAYNLQDKEKIAFYNSSGIGQQALDVTCFNAVYDMNGKKGPNQVGKDIGFVGSIYNSFETKSAAVLPYNKAIPVANLSNVQNNNYWKAAYDYCQNIDKDNNWILPDIDEVTLMFLNNKIVTGNFANGFWSRTPIYPGSYYHVAFGDGGRGFWVVSRSQQYFICARNNSLK